MPKKQLTEAQKIKNREAAKKWYARNKERVLAERREKGTYKKWAAKNSRREYQRDYQRAKVGDKKLQEFRERIANIEQAEEFKRKIQRLKEGN